MHGRKGIQRRGSLHAFLGRGRQGKSFTAACIIDRQRSRGADVIVADGDRTNATLSARYADATRPEDVSEGAARRWLERIIGMVVDQHKHVVLDMGGGDMHLFDLAQELQLVRLLEEAQLSVCAWHIMGNSPDDTSVLEAAERESLFTPARTALMLNQGASGEGPGSTFRRTMGAEAFQTALRRGAIKLVLPDLRCASAIQARQVSLEQAEATDAPGHFAPFSFVERQRVRIFRAQLEAMLAPVEAWLPT